MNFLLVDKVKYLDDLCTPANVDDKPTEQAIINLDRVMCIVPTTPDFGKEIVAIQFTDRLTIYCFGVPTDFMPK